MPRGKHLTLIEKATIIAERAAEKSYREIGKKIHREHTAVYRAEKRILSTDSNNTIRERVLKALEEKGLTDTAYADKCIELLNCKRYQLQPDGSLDLVPDNANQAKTLSIVKDIMGLDAPKHDEITHKHYDMTPSENEEILIIRRRYKV